MLLAQLHLAGLFEAGMLVCFGVSWPVAIVKTLRTRRVAGKSLGFLTLIFAGYLSGIGAKLALAAEAGPVHWVVWLYALNAAMVAAEIGLYLRYRQRDGDAGLGPAKVPVE